MNRVRNKEVRRRTAKEREFAGRVDQTESIEMVWTRGEIG